MRIIGAEIQLHSAANKVDVSRAELPLPLRLLCALTRFPRADAHRGRPGGHEHDARAAHGSQGLGLAGLQLGEQQLELGHRGLEDPGPTLAAALARARDEQRRLGPLRVEGQCAGEEVDVVAVGARTEARVNHVVAARHALDDVAGEVGVDAVRRHVDGLARAQAQVVHADQRDQRAVVFRRVLLLQAREQVEDVGLRAEVGAREVGEGGLHVCDCLWRGGEHGFADLFE